MTRPPWLYLHYGPEMIGEIEMYLIPPRCNFQRRLVLSYWRPRFFLLLHSFVLIKHVLPTGPQVSPYNHWKPWPGYHLRRLNCPEFSCLWMSDKVLARVTNLFASFFQDATAAQFTATATILGSYLPTVFVTRWRLRSTPPHGKHSETVIGWASAGSSPPLEQKHRNA